MLERFPGPLTEVVAGVRANFESSGSAGFSVRKSAMPLPSPLLDAVFGPDNVKPLLQYLRDEGFIRPVILDDQDSKDFCAFVTSICVGVPRMRDKKGASIDTPSVLFPLEAEFTVNLAQSEVTRETILPR